MNKCLQCQATIGKSVSFLDLFSFRPPSNQALCSTCKDQLLPYVASSNDCLACKRKLTKYKEHYAVHSTAEGDYCHDCWRWLELYPSHYLQHQHLFAYNDFLKACLHAYKYMGDYRQGYAFSQALSDFAQEYPNYIWTVLASSSHALKKRQFHSTALLLELAHIPYINLLTYQGDGKQQAKKNRKERINLPQIFSLQEKLPPLDSYQGLILFDDVYTTGATLLRAKELLYPLCEERSLSCISLTLARDSETF